MHSSSVPNEVASQCSLLFLFSKVQSMIGMEQSVAQAADDSAS